MMISKNLTSELFSIIFQYLESEDYEFTTFFDNEKTDRKNKKNNLLVFSRLKFEGSDIFDEYDNFYFSDLVLNNPLEYLDWCKKNNLDERKKFNAIINFLYPEAFQNSNLLSYILEEDSRVVMIFLEANSVNEIKKKLIEKDLECGGRVMQRLNCFPEIQLVTSKLEEMKNLTITIEEIDLEYKNIDDFLYDPENFWLFNKKHFENPIYFNDNKSFIFESKFAIVTCMKK